MEKHLKLQSEIKREWAAVQKAQADACPPEVLIPMRTDLGKKLELYKRLSAILPAQKRPPEPTGAVPGPSSQPPPPVTATPTSTVTLAADPVPSEPGPVAPEPAQLPPPPSITATELQNPSVPNPIIPPTEVTTQTHRAIQQQNQPNLTQPGILP